ncbi:MAG TPA: NADPH-dependent FMN reductase, partial [Chloroflexota bacterium]|nr:NADPH-dependent FMN reductase [Chloroflexota bacterium]
EKERRKMQNALAKQSRRFHARLLESAYPTPSVLQLMMFRMGRTSAKLLADDDNLDHTYYRNQGWFDSDYFYPAKLGPLKKAVGAAFDWTAAHMAKQR